MTEKASAEPQKRLFLELLTRDITLEDAVLDLIDNSINSILVTRQIDLVGSFDEVISDSMDLTSFKDFRIDIDFDEATFSLTDNCGGISYEAAKTSVFQFGRPGADSSDILSVYGIGLKRALFKLGDKIMVASHRDEPFAVVFKTPIWAISPEWFLPLRKVAADRIPQGTTCIRVAALSPDTKDRLNDPEFFTSLSRRIRETYCFFINRFCSVWVNGQRIDGEPIHIGEEESFRPSVQADDVEGVRVIVHAGLAPKSDWVAAEAGWYIFCNGRAVVFADRTRLTGWESRFPQFVSKFRGFRGIVFFFSRNPERLPWTTTKTDINEESLVYQRALNMMYTTGRPVLTFLGNLYPNDEIEAEAAKTAAEGLQSRPLTRVVSLPASTFQPPARRAPTTVNVQFKMKVDDLNRARQHLRNPSLSARKLAEIAFLYYLENEVG